MCGVQRCNALRWVQGKDPCSGLRVEGPHRVKGETPWQVKGGSQCPGSVVACDNSYWVLPAAKMHRGNGKHGLLPIMTKGSGRLKLTRHNGRAGKNGTYNPKHNDRRFNVENSEHIDQERVLQNVYWNYIRGTTKADARQDPTQDDYSFADIEQMYYNQQYMAYVTAQNGRNEKARHTERNRTVEDLLTNNKTCPEETIYQMGTMDESVTPEQLLAVVNEFHEELEKRFGSHVHILDWALHLDEATPHIHERHVFDAVNRYGELCPQQEKALEELGIPLPHPEKPKGKHNNRKQTFDSICRTMLADIAEQHGLQFDREPSYGGREYLEKQDYILQKQRDQMAQQEGKLNELSVKIQDVDKLISDVSAVAYDKAVEKVTAEAKVLAHEEDLKLVKETRKWVEDPSRKMSKWRRAFGLELLDKVVSGIRKHMRATADRLRAVLMRPERREEAVVQIQEHAIESVKDLLRKYAEEQQRTERKRKEQNMER